MSGSLTRVPLPRSRPIGRYGRTRSREFISLPTPVLSPDDATEPRVRSGTWSRHFPPALPPWPIRSSPRYPFSVFPRKASGSGINPKRLRMEFFISLRFSAIGRADRNVLGIASVRFRLTVALNVAALLLDGPRRQRYLNTGEEKRKEEGENLHPPTPQECGEYVSRTRSMARSGGEFSFYPYAATLVVSSRLVKFDNRKERDDDDEFLRAN